MAIGSLHSFDIVVAGGTIVSRGLLVTRLDLVTYGFLEIQNEEIVSE